MKSSMKISEPSLDRSPLPEPPRGSRTAWKKRHGEAILQAVVHAGEAFLKNPDWEQGIPEVLRRLGQATGASRVYVFENRNTPDGSLLVSQRYEWTAPGVRSELGNSHLQEFPLYARGFHRWAELLAAGQTVQGSVADFPQAERELLREQQILSLAVVPIVVEDGWWGFMGFDDCESERSWSPSVLAALRTGADLFGAMVTRRYLEERWRSLADATSDGILFHDGVRILDANHRAAELVGWPLNDVIGRNPFDFIAPACRDIAREHARADSRVPYEVSVIRRDGSEFPAEFEGKRTHFRGSEVRVVIVRDLTLRKQGEENERRLLLEQRARREAEAAERRAEFLAEVSRVLGSSMDTSTTLAQLARVAVPYLADSCVIDLVEGPLLRSVAVAGVPVLSDGISSACVESGGSRSPDPVDLRVMAGDSVLIRDSESGADPAGDSGTRCTLRVPVRSAERVLGIMTLRTAPDASQARIDEPLAEELARRAGVALQHARLFHEAHAAVRSREEILSVVTHDLRNPLGVVLGGAATLLELNDDPVQRRMAELISKNAKLMNRMVNDLLEVTRIEHGRLNLEFQNLPAGALLQDAAAMMRPLAELQSIRLEAVIGHEATHVRADPARVLQVLSNLVGNAIKFTPPGGLVRVEVTAGPGEARFTVSDTGPGIPADQIPHLFGAFWQANSSDRRGLGLGLSIARGIVEGHGGRIWVQSEPGAGSTFFFTLPVSGAGEEEETSGG
jgi:PAS domain S-box-containing protein